MTESAMIMTTTGLEISQMRDAAGKATAMLRVLSNEDRLLLLCQLTEGEKCVSELEELLGIHQPTLSQQLGVLRNEGMVSTRRESKNIYYKISDPRVLSLLSALYCLYCPQPEPAKLQASRRR